MTITTLDRPALRSVTNQFVTELKDLADKLGLDIEGGGGTYGGGTGTIKIQLSVRDVGNGTGKSGAQNTYEIYARSHGIALDSFGKRFQFKNDIYEICAAYPASPVYRFGAKCVSGRNTGTIFKFSPKTLKRKFPAKGV